MNKAAGAWLFSGNPVVIFYPRGLSAYNYYAQCFSSSILMHFQWVPLVSRAVFIFSKNLSQEKKNKKL